MINVVYFYFFAKSMQEQRLIKHYSDIGKLNKKNCKKFFDLCKRIYSFFDKIKLNKSDVILAVSGGADSMLMSCLILKYFYDKNLPTTKIHIAHCNHKIRLESEDEAKMMSDFFSNFDFHLFERNEKGGHEDESSLRNRRYSQLSSLQKSTASSYIFLGHHLNDRVESSILHMMRGASVKGFLNMHQIQKHPLLPHNCEVCRPLLDIPKSEILNVCKEIGLPYFEDKTNQDCSISKRNRIRHNIIEPLSTYGTTNGNENKFLQSFVSVYECIEKTFVESKFDEKLLYKTFSHPLRKADFSYKLNFLIENIDEKTLLSLFELLGLRSYISSNMINERINRLHKAKNGDKFFHGVNFFIHEKELYIIKAKRYFWKRKNNSEENLEINISSMNDINYFGLNLNIPRDELIGGTIRLPEQGDIFAGKSWHRRALNQKIPMRWRDWIPLAIKDGKVIHMRKNIRK